MVEFVLTVPVVLIVFNRPSVTKLVFAEIRKAKPKTLLIIADGARADIEGEAELCKEVRSIVQDVDWHCEVLTNFADKNMGCKNRVSSGLDWVFSEVEEAIILEDDCLPHQSFFRFCQELLEYYRCDERIGMISGDNFQFGQKRDKYSYYFSSFTHIWGWATWRRSWKKYDVNMTLWPKIKEQKYLRSILYEENEYLNWQKIFQKTYKGEIDTWDFQWVFANMINNRLNIMPNVNLVENIGFGLKATHTKNKDDVCANMQTKEIFFPLVHPEFIIRNIVADSYKQNKPNFISRIIGFLKKI